MQDDNLIQKNVIFSIENIKEVVENYCTKNNISSEIKYEIDKILNTKNEEISNLRIVNTRHSNFSEKEKYKWCEMQYKVNLQIQRSHFKEYITRLVNFYCPFYIYDTKNWDLEDGNLSEEWELALSDMDRYCTFLKKSWIEIKEELSNEVFNYCDKNSIESNIRFALFEKCELAFKIEIITLWGNFLVKVQRIVTVYCNDNSVSEEVLYILNQLIKIDWELVFEIIKNAHENAITSSEATKILKSLKKFYKNVSDIKPIKSDFLSYLRGNVNVVKDLSTEQLKIYVAEYIVHEELKNKLHYQKAKDKQQTLLDITPHQTLSIETTSAHVEESKKEFDFKRYAEVANGRINKYGEHDEDLCKEYEEILLSDGYKEWLKTLPTLNEIFEEQDKKPRESYSKIAPNPLGLRRKTGTFIVGYGNDWQHEEVCMAFHYFLKNKNKPLTIKQIQANIFPRYSELVIIRLLDDLVEHLEIEYTKEKINNEDVYKIEPLEMFLWDTTNTHFLSKKMRREAIIEIVERVRTNVYDGHYQKAKKEIELDVLVNFLNPIDEIKERIETVRGKLEKRVTAYYKVDDIDTFVEMIQNRHLPKMYPLVKTVIN